MRLEYSQVRPHSSLGCRSPVPEAIVPKSIIEVILGVVSFGTVMAADSASIYASKCTMCHGDGGKGTAMGPKLAGTDFIKGDAGPIKKVIEKGVWGSNKKYPNFPMAMPKYTMSDAEINALVRHLKSL
ncbi:MAG: c-type cytochrome [Thermodesulfobacteriota bacterium]